MNIDNKGIVFRYPYVAAYTASHMAKALALGVNPAQLTNTINGLKKMNEKNLDLVVNEKSITFTYKGKKLEFNYETKDDLRYTLFEINEQFHEEQYGLVDPKGKTIIDIGSAYSDTPIYFAVKGAAKIFGYELDKHRFDIGKSNVSSNGLDDKIVLQNKGVSQLSEVEYADVLKMDCEGCEYNLIKENAELGKFKEIILEYHEGYMNLTKILQKNGFKCINKYMPYYNIHDRKIMDCGILYAYK